ncbi:MAG: hypothetical protein H3C58_09400 [Fimbriimonadaceae bacterium]|nr:hypothetical protein [Fimbriimonadaceae bacterium]
MLTTRPEDQKKAILLLVAIVGVISMTGFMFVSQGRARTSKKVAPKFASAAAPTTGSTTGAAGDELKTRVADLFGKDLEYHALFQGLDPFRPKVQETNPDEPDVQTPSNDTPPVGRTSETAVPPAGRPSAMSGYIGRDSENVSPVRPRVPDGVGIQAKTPDIVVQGVITGDSAMAVLRVDNQDKFLAVGDTIGPGAKIEAITEAGVRIRVNGESRLVPVGKGLS